MSRYEGSIADQMFDLVSVRGWAADRPGDSPAAVLPSDEAAALLRSVLPHQLQSPPTPGIVILSSCCFKFLKCQMGAFNLSFQNYLELMRYY